MKKDKTFKEAANKIGALLSQMQFSYFTNGKKYSFDYQYKEVFEIIDKELKQLLDEEEKIPRSITSSMPIFLPKETARIAFFESQAKSVKAIDAISIIQALENKAFDYQPKEDDPRTIEEILANDLKTFNDYNKKYTANEYYIDTFSTSVRFNAYDSDDKMLIEKSYVLGGLVFDIDEKDFSDKIVISFPQYRKKRSDKKNDYLGLTLLSVRPIKSTQIKSRQKKL
ncbi:MAG: hypothetical protein WC253_04395 [Sulfurovaceae bacterium]